MTEPAETPPHLIVLSGPHKGDVIVVDDALPVVFGTQTGVTLPDPQLAPVHCQVLQSGGRWFLQDFGSPGGTWLGDDRVQGIRPLEFGRSFRIGTTHVALLEASQNEVPQVTPALPSGEIALEADAEPAGDPSATDVLEIQTPRPVSETQAPLGLPSLPPLSVHDSLGDYDIVEILGEGSMGVVYKGYDRRRRRIVAVKVLDGELAQDQKAVARFLRGAKTGGRMAHRHIVKILGAGHASGRIYVTMEFVEGLNLEQFCMASGGKLIPKVALGIMARVTEALVYAHGKDVLHRSVNPRNILIGPGGAPKLADLALAKRGKARSRDALKITSKGQVVSQSVYSPPEALLGEAMDARGDVWGVGATLFRILTDKAPYGADRTQLTQRIMTGAMEDTSALLRRASPQLRALLERCLQPNPSERFQRMRDLREAIAELPEIE